MLEGKRIHEFESVSPGEERVHTASSKAGEVIPGGTLVVHGLDPLGGRLTGASGSGIRTGELDNAADITKCCDVGVCASTDRRKPECGCGGLEQLHVDGYLCN